MPNLAQLIRSQLAFSSPLAMCALLELVHCRLTEDRRKNPLNLPRVKGKFVFVRSSRNQLLKNQHFAKSRGQFC